MQGPEASNPLLAGLLSQLVDGKLLQTIGCRQLGEGEETDKVMTLHDVVQLDSPALRGLLQFNERHACVVHSRYSKTVSG